MTKTIKTFGRRTTGFALSAAGIVRGNCMKTKVFFALFFIFGIVCNAQQVTKVYVSGSYSDGVTENACYWVDGNRVNLSGGYKARGIAVEKRIVYVAGHYLEGGVDQGCYWINGEKHNIPQKFHKSNDSPSNVNGIGVIDGKVYVVGRFEGNAACWVDGELTILSRRDQSCSRIAVSDGSAYFVGIQTYFGTGWYTVYGRTVSVGGNYCATGIAVANGKVYVSGYNNNPVSPCYWIDGARVDLPKVQLGSSIKAYTSDIAVSNGKVYVSGSYDVSSDYNYTACYWVDNTRVDLTDGARTSGIAVANGKVYVLGTYKQGSVEFPCYWIDGARKALPGGKSAMGIVCVTE